jgi:hypothetical protein
LQAWLFFVLMVVMRTKLFYDAEFTGLHQATGLISIALCAEDGREFYAEFSDFDVKQCDHWINQNVLALTRWANNPKAKPFSKLEGNLQLCFGDYNTVKSAVLDWLSVYDSVEIWADCLAWDWVLFCHLFGGALQLPKKIFYMPFDLVTLFYCKGLDADTPRLAFVEEHGAVLDKDQSHNALFDARVTQLCHGFLS